MEALRPLIEEQQRQPEKRDAADTGVPALPLTVVCAKADLVGRGVTASTAGRLASQGVAGAADASLEMQDFIQAYLRSFCLRRKS
jgi:hypothetical protein